MVKMQVIFSSELEAKIVADQLYNFNQIGPVLKVQDFRALKLAASLSNIDYIFEGDKCPLPFPRNERECSYQNTPKIYVACLAAYNSGHLHGLWIDATQDPEDIQEDIEWMLSWSPVSDDQACEEWAIHDYEDFGDVSLSEHENIKYISKLAQILDNAQDAKVMSAWLDYAKDRINEPDLDKLVEDFDCHYCGHWDSERDFVFKSDEVEELLNWSEFEKQFKFLSFHINWDSVARDLFIDGYDSVKASPHGIYVFREYYG
jgi:antirestriction protein